MPSPAAEHPVASTLQAVVEGDTNAAERLLPLVYDELRALAAMRMRGLPPGNTLQPTALVHEVYVRLSRGKSEEWEGRSHFFAAAARAMRDILVDQARHKAALKRGGDRQRVSWTDAQPEIGGPSDDLLALDEALRRLEAQDARKGQLVNLRYFAGLTTEETATVLGVSSRTVEAQWQYTKRWLVRQLSQA